MRFLERSNADSIASAQSLADYAHMLITCPDCQQSISDAAPACPHCGRPRDAATTHQRLPIGSDNGDVAEAVLATRSAVTISDVILNSTILVTALLGLVGLVSLLFFRWLTIGSEKYTTAALLKQLFLLPAGNQDAPWYISIGLIGLFLIPTAAAILPPILYGLSHQNPALEARSVDRWAARFGGLALASLIGCD